MVVQFVNDSGQRDALDSYSFALTCSRFNDLRDCDSLCLANSDSRSQLILESLAQSPPLQEC